MKISLFFITGVFIASATVTPLSAQQFQDLNFESAQIIPVSTNADGSVNIATANAIPGWMAFAGTNQLSVIAYDTSPTGVAPPVSLLGGSRAPAIDGNFDVDLVRGSISQTGMVPTGSESLRFDVAFGGSLPFTVSLDGQDLSYSSISDGVNSSGLQYIIYGADVSAFGGQEETLTFQGLGILDDIQFSDLPVPEPGEFTLAGLGAALFAVFRRRRLDRHPRLT